MSFTVKTMKIRTLCLNKLKSLLLNRHLYYADIQSKESSSYHTRTLSFSKTPVHRLFSSRSHPAFLLSIFKGHSRLTAIVLQGCASNMLLCARCLTDGIHKQVSALTAKWPAKKKVVMQLEGGKEPLDSVVAYAVAEELDFQLLRKILEIQGLYQICDLPIDANDALHIRAKYTVDDNKREVFFFRDGSVVCWSMPEVERREIVKFLQKHASEPYNQTVVLQEREEMNLKYTKNPTRLANDTLHINEESDEGQMVLEKYAFSNALAQSVKLGMWEASLDKFVDSIESVTEDLRDGRKIRMSRRDVLRKTGELFALRHLINLSSDLLDTPDFYWDREVLEPLYLSVCNHLSTTRRTRVMNEKLNHCCELTELLSSHLNDAHHTRLEIMIIVLIMVEVIFEIVHYIERFIDTEVQTEYTPREIMKPIESTATN